ncbi:hypothetical protein KBB68_02540 [Candidatus Babeliales bacterium]|nr:hypothetical protein [Candidatus Babeliales bacterium]
MPKKFQAISILSSILLILTFAGCDWCSCCKKENKPSKSELATPKETHPMVDHPEAAEPKIMPEHSFEPKMLPEYHTAPTMIPATMPIEPKEPSMPSAPKTA